MHPSHNHVQKDLVEVPKAVGVEMVLVKEPIETYRDYGPMSQCSCNQLCGRRIIRCEELRNFRAFQGRSLPLWIDLIAKKAQLPPWNSPAVNPACQTCTKRGIPDLCLFSPFTKFGRDFVAA